VLVLQILAELHGSYGIEIAAWSALVKRIRDGLATASPLSLYGKYLQICGGEHEITANPSATPRSMSTIVPLDPHLEALAIGLGVPPQPAQLSLFVAIRT
jgi:hypothetical protein